MAEKSGVKEKTSRRPHLVFGGDLGRVARLYWEENPKAGLPQRRMRFWGVTLGHIALGIVSTREKVRQ